MSETMMGYSRIVISFDFRVVLAHAWASDNLKYPARCFGFPELSRELVACFAARPGCCYHPSRARTKGSMMRAMVGFLLLPLSAIAADDFKLNAQEYFERPGINVMYGQDYYPEGHQGGLSILMHDERVASNGDVRLEPAPGQWSPIPKPGNRTVDQANQQIVSHLAYPDPDRDRKGFNPIVYPNLNMGYTVRAVPDGESIRITVDFDQPVPKEWVGKVGFN